MPPYINSTFSHGLSDNVRSPTKKMKRKLEEMKKEREEMKKEREEMKKVRTRTRTRTSDSDSNESTTSKVSFKSDQSKEDVINFRETLSPPRVPLKHKASTGSNCSSIKTDRSQDFIYAKKRYLREEMKKKRKEMKKERTRTRTSDSDSDESTTSNVSFKSDESKKDIINFRETLSPLSPAWPVSIMPPYINSTFIHELSDNVLSPL